MPWKTCMLKLKTGSNAGSDTLTHDPSQPGQNRWPGDSVPSLGQATVRVSALHSFQCFVRWQEGHQARSKPCSTHSRGSLPEHVKEEDPRGTSWPRFTWKNDHVLVNHWVHAVITDFSNPFSRWNQRQTREINRYTVLYFNSRKQLGTYHKPHVIVQRSMDNLSTESVHKIASCTRTRMVNSFTKLSVSQKPKCI